MGWISVKDRLPKSGEKVIVAVKHNYDYLIQVAIYKNTKITAEKGTRVVEKWFCSDVNFYYNENYGEITHWMPLPKSPKGE